MSSEDEKRIEGLGDAELLHEEHQIVKVAGSPAATGRPGKSLRFVAEPCAEHAENPPGEQIWVEGGEPDPITDLPPKERDPNGFVHGCPACEANAHVVEEG